MNTNPFTLLISFEQLTLLVMILFMVVGVMRGVKQEAITSGGLVVLLVLLVEPALARPFANYASRFVRLMLAFIRSNFAVDPQRLLDAYGKVSVPFSGENPYPFLIAGLVIFVLLSYSSRGLAKDATALGRILGGLLGILNGYLAITLVREYLVKYLQQRGGLSAAAAPSEIGVALTSVPSGGITSGGMPRYVLFLAGAFTVLLLLTTVSNWPLKKKAKSG